MNILRNIELSIVHHLENNSKYPIETISQYVKQYFENKKEKNNEDIQKYNKYMALYENERIKNKIEYDLYLNQRAELYDEWKKSNSKASAIELINKKYIINDVPEIYTYSVINTREPKMKKECPENKVLNPKNGKCINDPNIKTIKKDITNKDVKKECPEGKILNPKTGRCINDPNIKTIKKSVMNKDVKKECPDGKILNPKTGRCIKDPNYKKDK
jgi:hypothetical protein